MIERKDKFIRIRVIGGSGIFDSIINILKKPIVSKLLTSAGKSVASVLGERLVNRLVPAIQPSTPVVQTSTPVVQQSTRVQELISKYKPKHTPQVSTISGSGMSIGGVVTTTSSVPTTTAITIQEYVKLHKRGAGIKQIL